MPGQARLGDNAKVSGHSHGCPVGTHTCIGPAITGSPDVFVNSMPAHRNGDIGIHAVCCGPNMWTPDSYSGTVFINGKEAVRKDDDTKHCGTTTGAMIEGSADVITGD